MILGQKMIFWGEGVEERMIGVVKKSPANAPGKIKDSRDVEACTLAA